MERKQPTPRDVVLTERFVSIVGEWRHEDPLYKFVEEERRLIDSDYKSAVYYSLVDNEDTVQIQQHHGVKSLSSMYPLPPNDFSLPVVAVNFPRHVIPHVTSPWGIVPSIVKGKDGRLYKIENAYFFNAKNETIKLEMIIPLDEMGIDAQVVEEDFGLLFDEIPTVEAIPSFEDSRFIPMGEDDYSMLEDISDKIDNGTYVRIPSV